MMGRLLAATWPERVLALRALTVLLLARAGLLLLPFPLLRRVLDWYGHQPHGAWSTDRIAWAVQAAARRLPRGLRGCLAQALAAEALLRRYGQPAVVRIGVRWLASAESGRLEAHAWVESAGRVVVGGLADLASYVPLASPTSAAVADAIRHE